MLATGNSAAAAITRLKQLKPRSIKFVCLLTCPEGIAALQKAHPDVPIFTAAIDRQLNEHGYILPGLGDAGAEFSGRSKLTCCLAWAWLDPSQMSCSGPERK
jgi:uracil phosphoribosyltransferase